MIHISKDPSVPIRKNVTFIPFRTGGTACSVTLTGPEIAMGGGVRGERPNHHHHHPVLKQDLE